MASSSLRHNLDVQEFGSSATISELMKLLEGPMQSTITFDLPITGRHTIHVVTQMSAPLYGTEFRIDTVTPSAATVTTVSNIRDFTNLEKYIARLCETSAQKYIMHEDPAGHQVSGTTDIMLVNPSTGEPDERRVAVMIENEKLALVLKTKVKSTIAAMWDGTGGGEGPTMLARVRALAASTTEV